MPPSAFRYTPRPYVRPRYEQGGTIGELLRLQANQQAAAELRRGDISAQMWSNVGNTIGNSINNYMQERQQAPIRAMQAESAKLDLEAKRREAAEPARLSRQDSAFLALLEKQPQPDPREVIAIYGPQRGMAIAQGFNAFTELQSGAVKDAREAAGRLAIGAKASSPQLLASFWPQIKAAAVKGGLGKPEDIPDEPTPEYLDGVIGWATGKGPAAPELMAVNPGDTVIDKNKPDAGAVFTAPKPVEQPKPDTRSLPLQANDALKAGDIQEYNRIMRVIRDEAAAGRAPQGAGNGDPGPLETIIGPDGKPIRVARRDAVGKTPASGTSKPATGLEKRALNFFNRAQQADVDLEGLEAEVQKLGLAGQAGMAILPNFLQSDLGQQYTQAQRAFTEARLRKDSGAAIPEQEFENDRKTYFVQPGDSKETQAQKRRARAAILSSLGFESGQALAEFVGDVDEARSIVDGYKARAAKPADNAQVPNMTGVKPGFGRKFTEGPFKGQTWTMGPNGP